MLTVIGCGNLNRRDDGVGVIVATRLRDRLARHPVPGVKVLDCGTAGMEVVFAARGTDELVLVDACRTGAEPGAVFRVPGEEVGELPPPGMSLHAFRWDHALAAGRQIFRDQQPRTVTVWLVEAADLELGHGLSDPVEAGARAVYDRILERIAEHALHRHDEAGPVELAVRRGMLYLDRAVHERLLEGRDGVVPLLRGDRLVLVPVDQTAGGLFVKQRNPQGDRAVDLGEVLREHGWDDWSDYTCLARWDAEDGGLALTRTPT